MSWSGLQAKKHVAMRRPYDRTFRRPRPGSTIANHSLASLVGNARSPATGYLGWGAAPFVAGLSLSIIRTPSSLTSLPVFLSQIRVRTSMRCFSA